MAPPLAFGLELDELDDDEEAAETAQKACGHWVQSRGTENWHSFPSSQSGHDGVPSSHCTQPVCRAKRLGYEPSSMIGIVTYDRGLWDGFDETVSSRRCLSSIQLGLFVRRSTNW